MSGATLTETGGSTEESSADETAPRRATFGRRHVRADPAVDLRPRSFDIEVPDLRRRIDANATTASMRLRWKVAGFVIAGLSLALWAAVFEIGSFVWRQVPDLF